MTDQQLRAELERALGVARPAAPRPATPARRPRPRAERPPDTIAHRASQDAASARVVRWRPKPAPLAGAPRPPRTASSPPRNGPARSGSRRAPARRGTRPAPAAGAWRPPAERHGAPRWPRPTSACPTRRWSPVGVGQQQVSGDALSRGALRAPAPRPPRRAASGARRAQDPRTTPRARSGERSPGARRDEDVRPHEVIGGLARRHPRSAPRPGRRAAARCHLRARRRRAPARSRRGRARRADAGRNG